MIKDKYPMQPIVDARFEANPIINWLATEVSNMNDICLWCSDNDVPDKYQEQIAQLVGYSVSGYGSLSYVSDESYERAANQVHIQPTTPQTKEVEWVNGDQCRYTHDVEHEYIYIGEHPHGDGHYVFSEETGITYIANGYLLDPESEADKLEREELEAAKELFTLYMSEWEVGPYIGWDGLDEKNKNAFLAIVRKTRYRKGE